jgi:hypothetical protein
MACEAAGSLVLESTRLANMAACSPSTAHKTCPQLLENLDSKKEKLKRSAFKRKGRKRDAKWKA